MSARQRLADRRTHETVATEILGQRFKIGLGRHTTMGDTSPAGRHETLRVTVGDVAEVFINSQKPNSLLDVLCSDGAILMSLLIQYGCPIDTIRHAMKREVDGAPASPFGFAVDLLNPTTEAKNGHSSTAKQT